MKINLDTPGEEARIELVPLIDVIFCILTFFLLAALQLTRQQAINVDLPKAKTGTTQMQEMLIVSIDAIGQTYLDQQPVTRDQLYQALRVYNEANPNGLMVLYASKMASYNDVIQVLDQLRSVGGDRVALGTLPSDGDQPTANPGAPIVPGVPTAPPLINPGTPGAPVLPTDPTNQLPIQPGAIPANPNNSATPAPKAPALEPAS